MSILLFSRKGIHFESREKGDVMALFVPVREQVRTFTDIPQPSTANVRERYGQTAGMPIWRQNKSGAVEVYGTMPQQLLNRRQGVTVYLAQDFAPKDCDVFFFVLGSRWIVHGVKIRGDDGRETWGISKIDGKSSDNAVDIIVNAVSDRMLEANAENITIAVLEDDVLLSNLQNSLRPLGLKAMSFAALSKPKGLKPLYFHRDYSLIMLTFALFSLLILLGAITYLVLGRLKLETMKKEVAQLEEQIRQQQADRPLGHIRNPQDVLKAMAQREEQIPSSIIHAAGEAAASFGTLGRLTYETGRKNRTNARVKAELKEVENELLLYQEEVARSVLREKPWIREVERVPGAGAAVLEVEVKVE